MKRKPIKSVYVKTVRQIVECEVNRMIQNDKIQLFEDRRIRTAWDEEKEEWYFSLSMW